MTVPSPIRALTRSYAQVLFSRSQAVGIVLLLATLWLPAIGMHGLLAALAALVCAHLLGLRPGGVNEGLYGYNAVLTGLAVGSLVPFSPLSVTLAIVGACAMVLATAALKSSPSALPPLTVPFLLALWALVAFTGSLPAAPEGTLATLGALFFVPDPRAGALVVLAVLLWSRQGALLGAMGVGIAALVPLVTGGPAPALLDVNLALVAMAVGGVWFVPSRSSFALAALAAATTALLAVGLAPQLGRLGLPMSIAPFNLAVWGVLLAMRQRAEDRAPKAVDTAPGTPEQNLAYHLTRVARFGARYAVRFRVPVMGTWVVTQAEDDGPTHRDEWKHALDFEVRGPDDRLHRGDGAQLADWFCYRLEVLAPADGTVVTIVDGVRDNPVGHVDLEDNWGNVVVLWHGPGLYSLVAHLSPGTIAVREGDAVRRGDVLGRCGSSGRSPHPHLHFQLQGSPVVGAPTLPMELHDVVDVESGELRTTWSPKTDDRIRNLQVDNDLAEALELRPGSHWTWVDGEREVQLDIGVDALGVPAISDGSGRLVYAAHDDLLTLFAPLAPPRSPLHVLRAALARIPFEPGLSWTDPLPPQATVPRMLRPLWDLVAPFVGWTGVSVQYRLESEGRDWVVSGRTADGAITTHARLSRERGPTELKLGVRRRTSDLQRAAEPQPPHPNEAVR